MHWFIHLNGGKAIEISTRMQNLCKSLMERFDKKTEYDDDKIMKGFVASRVADYAVQ